MKLFGDSPQERAMRVLIHDTNGDFSLIGANLSFAHRALDHRDIDEAYNEIRLAQAQLKILKDNIDRYYEKFAKDFKG